MTPASPGSRSLKSVGRRIRVARENKGVSLRQFADKVGLTPSYFSKVERGEALAGNETYGKICAELELDADEMLEQIGLVDKETEELVRKHFREVKGYLRQMKSKRSKGKDKS